MLLLNLGSKGQNSLNIYEVSYSDSLSKILLFKPKELYKFISIQFDILIY